MTRHLYGGSAPSLHWLGKNNVIWLSRVTPWGFGAGGVNHNLRWFLRLLWVSVLCALTIPDLMRGPLNIILTFFLLSVWLVFPPNLGAFFLHGQELLVIGLMFTYGLTTTFGIVVRCNTTIRPESVHCTLVAFSVKYVCLLMTTLNVVVLCNTSIRSESIRCALITCGQVLICCSATTLGIVVYCDTTIRPKSVHCVLAVIRLLPIYRARLR